MTMHVAEMDYELAKYKEEYNLTPVQYLNKLGILDSNFISAHTVLVDDDDIRILKENGVGVSHNIGANAKGAKGVAPIIKMKEEGINIGLGTDGPMSGNTLDIIGQMVQVGKIHKLFNMTFEFSDQKNKNYENETILLEFNISNEIDFLMKYNFIINQFIIILTHKHNTNILKRGKKFWKINSIIKYMQKKKV